MSAEVKTKGNALPPVMSSSEMQHATKTIGDYINNNIIYHQLTQCCTTYCELYLHFSSLDRGKEGEVKKGE